MTASFHAYVCMLEWLGCLTGFIYGLCNKEDYTWLWITSLVGFFLFPVVNELFLCLKGSMSKRSVTQPDQTLLVSLDECIPIVYSPGYNIHAFGAEKLHPFDASKYRRVYADLQESSIIPAQARAGMRERVHQPSIPSREFLQKIMSPWYLFTLNYSFQIMRCIELPVFFIPSWILRMRILDPMQRASRGSVDAACIARTTGWAINLSGGYHHATVNGGGGFCIYPDITLVTHYMEQWFGYKRFLIIDLDAHQGNGHERDHRDKDKFYIIDVYNGGIYPGDDVAAPFISDTVFAHRSMSDRDYLREVNTSLARAFQEFRPDFVVYNAGTDCMAGDPLGELNLSEQGVIDRDELVFRYCYEIHKVPMVMLLSGGYQQSNAPVIARSIRNLYEKFDLGKQEQSAIIKA